MNRTVVRSLALFVAPIVAGVLTTGVADAAPKKKKPADNDMTFEVDSVGPGEGAPPPTSGKPASSKPAAPPAGMSVKKSKPADNKPAGAASKTLERALKLYDTEDYAMSSIELNKVIEGQTKDDEANKQRAEFFMGKALFNMKYYSASLSYFDRIVQKGPEHRYYGKTLQWLASLSRFLPESAGVLEKIGVYTRQDLEQPALEPVRDELYYLLGRFHYAKGHFKDAIDLFAAVPQKSEFFPKAKFFEGITYVRENKGKEASDSFKAILRKVKEYDDPKKVPKVLREFEELANLSLGRVFYTTRQWLQSIKYYEKLPQLSPDWLASLFEASWAYYQMDGDSKALGNIHSVNSPFFENEFYPEAYILKAVIYFNRCNFDRSREAIDEFNNIFPHLKKELDEVLAKYPDNAQFYDYVIKVRSGEAGLGKRVQRAAAGALSDRTLVKTIEYVNELDRELQSLEKADPAWKSTAVAGNILQDLTLQKSLAANEAGQLARTRLQRLTREIQDLIKQSIKVEYETLNALKGSLTAGLIGDQANVNPNAKVVNRIVIDDEHYQWPFEGEYWKDELGYYRFKVSNKCEKK